MKTMQLLYFFPGIWVVAALYKNDCDLLSGLMSG